MCIRDRDDLKLERRLELAMEAVRFQDLIRWGDAPIVLADNGKKLPNFLIVPKEGNDLTLSLIHILYKGIPYAKAERFMPPVAADKWEGVRSSRAYGPTLSLIHI